MCGWFFQNSDMSRNVPESATIGEPTQCERQGVAFMTIFRRLSDEHGLLCPQCGGRRFITTNTEPLQDGQIRRRKTCRNCGHRLVTFEATAGRLRERYM
jgi:DNA-directed RNA polymerase subunit RPC12/RpoP